MCNQVITTPEGVTRNCKIKVHSDGWCYFHHPDEVEKRLIRRLEHENRKSFEASDRTIGQWIRRSNPDLYDKIYVEIDNFLKARNGES